MTDVENLAEQMDEDTSLRTLATSRPLEEVSRRKHEPQETYFTSVVRTNWNSMSTKRIGQTQNWQFDRVTRVRWSTDFPPAKSRLEMKEKSRRWKIFSRILGSGRKTYLLKSILLTGWARRMKGNAVRSRYSQGHCICTDAIASVGEGTFFVRSLERSPCGDRDLVCAFMQADTSCEMLARPPKAQEGRMDLATAWSDARHANCKLRLSEFLAGVLTECMGFTRGKLERCLLVHESNETRVVSHVDDHSLVPSCLIGQIPDTHCEVLWDLHRSMWMNAWIMFNYKMQKMLWRRWRNRTVRSPQRNKRVRPSPTRTVQSCCWETTVHYWGEKGSSVRGKMSVIQTRAANTCRFDTREEGSEILERNTTHESPLDDPIIETQRLVQGIEKTSWDTLTLTGLETQRRGKALIVHCAVLTNFSWPASVRDCPAGVRIECSGCTVTWVDLHTSHPERDWTEIPGTHKGRQQHGTSKWQRKQGASGRMNHIRTRFLLIQDMVFRKLLTTSAVETIMYPSDVGTQPLGRERFCRMRAMLRLGNAFEDTCSPGDWHNVSLVEVDNTSSCKSATCWAHVSSARQSSKVHSFLFISGPRDASRADTSLHETHTWLVTSRDVSGLSRILENRLSHLVRALWNISVDISSCMFTAYMFAPYTFTSHISYIIHHCIL